MSGSASFPRLVRVALITMFAMLLLRLLQFLKFGDQALHWPYELDYAEGIVWQQANMMFTHSAYGPINGFPAIVFHYTPLYHVAVRAVVALIGGDTLYTGRALSICATLLMAVVMGMIVARTVPDSSGRWARRASAATGGLAVFSLFPVMICGPVFRVDMLAVLLSFMGFWFGLKSFERQGYVYVAALCFVAAIYTKQTALAAPTAIFVLMLWLRPGLAFKGIAFCVVVGLIALVTLEVVTNGGFIRHIVLYNINRIEFRRLQHIPDMIAAHSLFFLAALFYAILRIQEMRKKLSKDNYINISVINGDLTYIGLLFYFFTSSLMLITLVKSGSFLNYFIEWLCVVAALAATALPLSFVLLHDDKQHILASPRARLFGLLVPFALGFQAFALMMTQSLPKIPLIFQRQMDALSLRVHAADKPIISDEMVLLLRSGKPVVWEPMIFTELALEGTWDERPFIKMIRNHAFAMFIMNADHDWTPGVSAAIRSAYPVAEKYGSYTVYLPQKPSFVLRPLTIEGTSHKSASKN